MGRHLHARFLGTYIENRVAATGDALTVALNAEWGAGKTFFVEHWAEDLKAHRRGVLLFDAWKNDTAIDPVLAFMSELQTGMQALREKLPIGTGAALKVQEAATGLFKAMRKAVLPATAVFAAGVLKKVTGVAVDEVMDAYKNGAEVPLDLDADELSSEAGTQLEKSLDIFFRKTMEDHRARTNATATFRQALEHLVEELKNAEVIVGPLYGGCPEFCVNGG